MEGDKSVHDFQHDGTCINMPLTDLVSRGFDVELRAEGHSIWTARRMGYGGGISPAEMLFRHGLMLGPKQAASLDAGLGSAGVRGIVFAVQPYE